MGIPYGLILDIAVVLLIVAAFIRTDSDRARIALGTALAIIVLLPRLGIMRPMGALWWIFYVAKLLCGLACVIYLKVMG